MADFEYSPADVARRAEISTLRDAAKAEVHRLAAMQGADVDRDKRAAVIAAGGTVSPVQPVAVQLANKRSELFDLERALEIHDAEAAKRRKADEDKYCRSVRPIKAIEKFVKGVTLAQEALVDLDDTKSNLQRQGLGFHPHAIDFALEAEAVFGHSRDKSSAFSHLLRELVARGHLSKLPKEIAA